MENDQENHLIPKLVVLLPKRNLLQALQIPSCELNEAQI
jgi:hypothetical protein